MNMILRSQLKEAQVRFRKLGYDLNGDNGSIGLRQIHDIGSTPEDYVRVYLRVLKNDSVDIPVYTLYFYTETWNWKQLGGSSYMPVEFAKKVHAQWGKTLKECEYFNEMKITGTMPEINECLKDIKKKSRI